MRVTASLRTGASAGFTLIELMITIVVATILITIAVPAYTSQIRKSRRTEAKTALLDLAAREERFFSTNSTYTAVPANLGYAGVFPQNVGSGYYQITVATPTATTFTATATPQGPQAGDSACAQFQLDNTGLQTATSAVCWN